MAIHSTLKGLKGRLIKVGMLVLCLIVTFPLVGLGQVSSPDWPEITQQNKPWTRWWWEGSAVNAKGLTWMMEEYRKAGLGGLEITPIYGVKGAEDQFIDFLSPKWMDMLQFTLKEGKRLDLGIDMAMASGWPFGGPWVSDQDASKYVAYKTYSLEAGKKFNEKISYFQEPIVDAVGVPIAISALMEPIASNPDLQLHAFDQVRFPKYLPLQVLMAYSDKGEKVNLTSKVDVNGTLNWTPYGGKWSLYAVFEGWHGKMVERAGPGGEGYAIDHFSHQATANYLSYFDKAFKGYQIKPLRSFFNDSYEVDDARGEADWTPQFFDEFQKRRGYDVRNYLPLLFSKNNDEQRFRVLCDYRETISDLLLANYTETWHKWSKAKGILIRNQAHGSPANILDLYAATDIPEIEGTDVLRIKFASSAANVTGKPLISSESATWENDHFLSRLADVRQRMDLFLLGGVNHTFYHGANYTPKEAPWPGWLFYAAVHFTPNNSFWTDFSKLNSYVARVQSFMQSGKPNNDVLLYLPIYDAFSSPGRSMLQHFDGIEKGFKGTVLEEGAEEMLKKGYGFDYISDRQILQTQVADKWITTGGVTYQTVVVPASKYIPLETFKKLVDLANNGAAIILYKDVPGDVPGFNDLETRQAAFKNLLTQIKFNDSGISGVKQAVVGNGSFILSKDLDKALTFVHVNRETMVDLGLQMTRRTYDKGYTYFIANKSGQTFNGWVPISKEVKSVALFDPMTGKSGFAALKKDDKMGSQVYLQLPAGESCILQTADDKLQGQTYPYTESTEQVQEVKGTWDVRFIKGGPLLPKDIRIQKLQSWTEFAEESTKSFSGTATYAISFKKPSVKAKVWLLNLGDVQESAQVMLNGKDIGTVIGPVYQLEISDAILKADNRLEISVSNSMANRIIYMDQHKMEWKKFYNTNMPAHSSENRGADGLFSAAKWQPKASGLIGPVSLTPLKYFKPPVVYGKK